MGALEKAAQRVLLSRVRGYNSDGAGKKHTHTHLSVTPGSRHEAFCGDIYLNNSGSNSNGKSNISKNKIDHVIGNLDSIRSYDNNKNTITKVLITSAINILIVITTKILAIIKMTI